MPRSLTSVTALIMPLSFDIVIALIYSVVAYFQGSLYDEPHRPIDVNIFQKEYDFIVVGGGSAGLLIY